VLAHRSDVNATVVRGIQHDSEELLLWDELLRIHCPALLVRGGQ
jgi:hypothetical protein